MNYEYNINTKFQDIYYILTYSTFNKKEFMKLFGSRMTSREREIFVRNITFAQKYILENNLDANMYIATIIDLFYCGNIFHSPAFISARNEYNHIPRVISPDKFQQGLPMEFDPLRHAPDLDDDEKALELYKSELQLYSGTNYDFIRKNEISHFLRHMHGSLKYYRSCLELFDIHLNYFPKLCTKLEQFNSGWELFHHSADFVHDHYDLIKLIHINITNVTNLRVAINVLKSHNAPVHLVIPISSLITDIEFLQENYDLLNPI